MASSESSPVADTFNGIFDGITFTSMVLNCCFGGGTGVVGTVGEWGRDGYCVCGVIGWVGVRGTYSTSGAYIMYRIKLRAKYKISRKIFVFCFLSFFCATVQMAKRDIKRGKTKKLIF